MNSPIRTFISFTIVIYVAVGLGQQKNVPLPVSEIYKPPTSSKSIVDSIDFSKASPVDTEYKKTFDACDGLRCHKDPNKLKALLRFGDIALFFESKMSLDLDGSWVACNCGNTAGTSDQCSTAYTWGRFPSEYDQKKPKEFCTFYQRQSFIDSNAIPYIVMPGGFGDHFAIGNKPANLVGELGVVIYGDKIVPVIVGDSGRSFQIGEGSAALFRVLGQDRCHTYKEGQCVSFEGGDHSVDGKVLYFIFPNSRISKEKLNKNNALELIRTEAMKKFDEFKNKF